MTVGLIACTCWLLLKFHKQATHIKLIFKVFTIIFCTSVMTIPPKLEPIIYGVGVFVIFTTTMILIKYITHHTPDNTEYFGLFSKKELMMGAVVALLLTASHVRKKKLNK